MVDYYKITKENKIAKEIYRFAQIHYARTVKCWNMFCPHLETEYQN
jgi:hypothetical protein